jgi:hypothetical protein
MDNISYASSSSSSPPTFELNAGKKQKKKNDTKFLL